MPSSKCQRRIIQAAALGAVSAAAASVMKWLDVRALDRIRTLSGPDYIEYQTHLHEHSYQFHLVLALIMGGLYLGLFALVVSLITRLAAAGRR